MSNFQNLALIKHIWVDEENFSKKENQNRKKKFFSASTDVESMRRVLNNISANKFLFDFQFLKAWQLHFVYFCVER